MNYYFPHDYHARHDPKLLALRRRHGLAGLGAYWCLVEFLYEQQGAITATELEDLAFDLRCEQELLASLIYDFDLFNFDDERKVLTCEAVTERLQVRAQKRENAQKSAVNRWSNANAMRTHSERIAPAMPTHSEGNAIKGKERKEKEKKEKENRQLSIDRRGEESPEAQDQTSAPVEKKKRPAPQQFIPRGQDVAILCQPAVSEAWEAFLDYRRRKGWPVTDYALQALIRKLRELRGDNPAGWRELLETAVVRGWRGIFEPRDSTTNNPKQTPTHAKPTLNDRYDDAARRLLNGAA